MDLCLSKLSLMVCVRTRVCVCGGFYSFGMRFFFWNVRMGVSITAGGGQGGDIFLGTHKMSSNGFAYANACTQIELRMNVY